VHVQVTLRSMFHQAFVTGIHAIPSHCCLHPPFWAAPAARDFVLGAAHARVAMVFVCIPGHSALFRHAKQSVVEQAIEYYKLCVRQARSQQRFCGTLRCVRNVLCLQRLCVQAVAGAG
jgi:hypothetical protein